MLLDKIRQDALLQRYNCLKDTCEDEGICVTIDARIDKKDYVVIKVDDYYNNLTKEYGFSDAPNAPDCLIVQQCQGKEYALTIVELKGVSELKRWRKGDLEKILAKFQSCFTRFMVQDFPQYFDQDFKRIQLYFVSNVDLYKNKTKNANRLLKIELLMNKTFRFRGKRYYIRPYMPVPSVKPCY